MSEFQIKNCCQRPFTEIEIDENGEVRTCCPSYLINYYSIGSIFKANSFDEIWNSEKAIKLRQSIINGTYEYCDTKICSKKIDNNNIDSIKVTPPYPKLVRFAYDSHCNLKCTICRDDFKLNSLEKQEKLDSIIEPILIPTLKNAEILSLTSSGEVTASEHSKKLIKRIIQIYPNIKFEILTNGLLFNENFCNSLGIKNKIDRITISMHAFNEKTYKKIMRGSNYNIVKKNLEYIFSLKKQNLINEVNIVFVVSSVNYKEIPKFIQYCIDNDAFPIIWEYRKLAKTEMSRNFDRYAVWQKKHKDYNKFVTIMNQTQKIYGEQFRKPPIFENLKKVSKKQIIENHIKYFLTSFKSNIHFQ